MIPQMLRTVCGQLLLWSALESNNSSTILTNSARDMSLSHSLAAFLVSWISNWPTKSMKHLPWNMKTTTPKSSLTMSPSVPMSTKPSPQLALKWHLLLVSLPSPKTIRYLLAASTCSQATAMKIISAKLSKNTRKPLTLDVSTWNQSSKTMTRLSVVMWLRRSS